MHFWNAKYDKIAVKYCHAARRPSPGLCSVRYFCSMGLFTFSSYMSIMREKNGAMQQGLFLTYWCTDHYFLSFFCQTFCRHLPRRMNVENVSLNLAVWPHTKRKKYRWNLNLVVAPRIILCHHQHCTHVYQGALPSSCLRYLNNAVSLQIYKEI